MALTKQTAAGVLVGLGSLAAIVTNPNFDPEDISNLGDILQKFSSHIGFEHSGKVYVASYAAAAASAVSVAYNALTGKAHQKK